VSETLRRIQHLASLGKLVVSDHAYDELSEDGILAEELMDGLADAIVIEDYPGAFKGPSVLVLQTDRAGMALHSVWGIPAGKSEPAVLVTAYRPNPSLWSNDFRKRKP
jgi:hypothetical protein